MGPRERKLPLRRGRRCRLRRGRRRRAALAAAAGLWGRASEGAGSLTIYAKLERRLSNHEADSKDNREVRSGVVS